MAVPPQSVFIIGAKTFTANAIGSKVIDAFVSPSDAAHTLGDTKISLDQSGMLAIGSSTFSLTNSTSTNVSSMAG